MRPPPPLAALALALTIPAAAEAAPVAGAWVIAKGQAAPWVTAEEPADQAEQTRLVGQTVTFGQRAVSGPAPLGCAAATYRTHEDTANLLFEGGLATPGPNGRPSDGVAKARRLGMVTRTVQTIETGCSEVAFHRFTPDTLVFGLNNRIYTLHPAPAAGQDRRREATKAP